MMTNTNAIGEDKKYKHTKDCETNDKDTKHVSHIKDQRAYGLTNLCQNFFPFSNVSLRIDLEKYS